MSTPVVSVVMSVYNSAGFLAESMASILAQQEVDLEFIVVDDGSTDESPAILDGVAARDRRVRIIRQENAGLTRALIRGCREARGDYIARQDSDDLSQPERLRMQLAAFAADRTLSFVSSWTEYCGPGGESIRIARGARPAPAPCRIIDPAAATMVTTGPSSHPSVMFRRSCYEQVGGYRGEFYFAQDWDLWYRLAEAGTFQMLESPLYRARFLPGSVSARHRGEQKMLVELAREALRLRMAGLSDQPAVRKAAAIRPERGAAGGSDPSRAAWLYFIGEGLRQNGDRRAIRYFVASLRENPLSGKGWLRLVQAVAAGRRTGSEQR